MHLRAITHFGPVIIATCFGMPAFSGDASNLEIIGFSDDGSIFSFEEFGEEDGSGFAYVNRHIVSKDGSGNRTIEFVDRTGTLSIAETRQEFSQDLGNFELAAFEKDPGTTLVFNPITELSADWHRASFTPVFSETLHAGVYELRLHELFEKAQSSKPPCAEVVEELAGYQLTLSKNGESEALVHQKRPVEIGAGCPLGYRIGAVHLSPDNSEVTTIAVLIHTAFYGFEGRDYRYHGILLEIE